MMRREAAAGLLALVTFNASAETTPALDPNELNSMHLRVIAVERGPEGERIWLGTSDDARRVAVIVGQTFADGSLLSLSWDDASVTIHVERHDPHRRLLRPWRNDLRTTFGTLRGAPFGDEGCPRFLARVEEGRAWVRTGGLGDELELGLGDELCGGWLVEGLEAGDAEGAGLLTLKRGDRLLRVAASRP